MFTIREWVMESFENGLCPLDQEDTHYTMDYGQVEARNEDGLPVVESYLAGIEHANTQCCDELRQFAHTLRQSTAVNDIERLLTTQHENEYEDYYVH